MPVTPRFSISQTDAEVVVEVHVPHVRVSGMDFEVDGREFSFWCKPYLLKLTFPGELLDSEEAHATYDHTKVRDSGRATAAARRADGATARRTTGRCLCTSPRRWRASTSRTCTSCPPFCSPPQRAGANRAFCGRRRHSRPPRAHSLPRDEAFHPSRASRSWGVIPRTPRKRRTTKRQRPRLPCRSLNRSSPLLGRATASTAASRAYFAIYEKT